MRRAIWSLAVLTAGAGVLVGCSKADTGCGSGADSATEAVSELVDAAVADDPERACRVTPDLSDEELRSNMTEIAEFVSKAGGRKAISVVEDADERMGSGHFVEVIASDDSGRVQFMVFQSDGAFIVGLGEGDGGAATPTSQVGR